MSAPPPYQNHPQQHPYGQPQQPPPGGPNRPRQVSPLQRLLGPLLVLAVFGGVGYYVWDYNTNPNGGQAKKEAAGRAQYEEDKTHAPEPGDCVEIKDPQGEPVPTIVDCDSPAAQYKTGEILPGQDMKCGPKFDYGIQHTETRGFDYTMCFNKL
ncbi:LppU/SCO3897 family protein [Streptomyces sp. NPDC055287]